MQTKKALTIRARHIPAALKNNTLFQKTLDKKG
jgi:hypothetical protein